MPRTHIVALVASALLLGGCALTPDGRVQHTFTIEVGSGVQEIKNLNYLYGDLGWRSRPISIPGPLSALSLTMLVPETFEINWEIPEGKKYQFSVPVRNKITGSLHGKEINFVIMPDHVEGYVATRISLGTKERVRFY